jgi:hypothetical protein
MSGQKKSGSENSDTPTTTQDTTKKTRRSQTKYPGLAPQVNGRFRKETIDFDYLDQLSPEEKAWLSAFMEEYNGANFNHEGEKLHTTKEQKKDSYHRNNARNRDLMHHQKAKGLLLDDSHFKEKDDTINNEDILIEALDSANDEKIEE